MKYSLFVLLIFLAACSVFRGMRKKSFVYRSGEVLPLLVPKGYQKSELQTDSAGNKTQIFWYDNNAALYFYFGDTTASNLPTDTSFNIAKYYPGDVRFFKGQDSSNALFWRESRYKNFRFGYRNINTGKESLFDSSVNYAAWQAIAQ
jgi:hypothetical protein